MTPVKTKLPFGAVVVVPIVLPEESRSWTVTFGSPSSPRSSLPGVPPPGLKSRQTTPVTAPSFGAGCLAWTEPAGTWSGGIPVSGSSATDPGRTGVLSTIPVCGVPVSLFPEGKASESGPGGLTLSTTDAVTALSAPRDGSCWYMIRQITPAAKSDTAMGMKTAILNATDQRMRSVRTAKMSPIAVTRAGTTATQIALFLIAVRVVSVVKSVR